MKRWFLLVLCSLLSVCALAAAPTYKVKQLDVDTNADGTYATLTEDLINGIGSGGLVGTPDSVTFYVSESEGNDTTGDGGEYAPFASIDKALQSIGELSAGTQAAVIIAPGSYTIDSEAFAETFLPEPEDPELIDWASDLADKYVSIIGSGTAQTIVSVSGANPYLHFSEIRDLELVCIGAGYQLTEVAANGIRANKVKFTLTNGSFAVSASQILSSFSGCKALVPAGRSVNFYGDVTGCYAAGSGSLTAAGTVVGNRFECGVTTVSGRVHGNYIESTGNVALSGTVRGNTVIAGSTQVQIDAFDCDGNTIWADKFGITITAEKGNANCSANRIQSKNLMPSRTGLISMSDATWTSDDTITILNNSITHRGAFAEPSDGNVSVFQRFNCDAHLVIVGTNVYSTIIPLMDSHPGGTLDPNRGTVARPTTLINNYFQFTPPSGAGPGDRIACVQRFAGGEFITSGNVFYTDSSLNTRTNFDHVAVWIASDGAFEGGSWRSTNDTFIGKFPSDALGEGIKKAAWWFDNDTTDPSAVEIINATVKLENHDQLAGQEAAGALSSESWYKAEAKWFDVDADDWALNLNGVDSAWPPTGGASAATDLTATAHRIFYSDGSGDVQELAFGSANLPLRSNGSTSAPSFAALPITTGVSAGNWKTFYSNGSGTITELALGTSGKVLTSNGASAAPTWETPGGGALTTFYIDSSSPTNPTASDFPATAHIETGRTLTLPAPADGYIVYISAEEFAEVTTASGSIIIDGVSLTTFYNSAGNATLILVGRSGSWRSVGHTGGWSEPV